MRLSYKFINTGQTRELEKIIISPTDANMAILNAMTNRPDMQIINPARDFASKMKSGYFIDIPDEEISAEAEIVNLISNAWHNKPEDNIFSILAEITRLYIIEKTEVKPPEWLADN